MKTHYNIIIICFILNLLTFSFVNAQETSNAANTQIIETAQKYFATYLGGTGKEFCEAIAVDDSGNIYVAGNTVSADFPTTSGAYNRTPQGKSDIFIAKFDSKLKTLLASTLIGGGEPDCAYSILISKDAYVYIAGYTDSKDFPTTASSYSTKHSGAGDAFILKMDKDLKTVIASTFIGGSGNEDDWRSPEIVQDKYGNIYIAGITNSEDFPITSGAFRETYNGGPMDVFVSKFDPGLNQLLASTLIGGSGDDRMGRSLDIDIKNNELCIGGYTFSSDFPISENAYGNTVVSGILNGFILKLRMDLTEMTASTILVDGWIYCLMIHENGDIYVGGHAGKTLPTTSEAYYRSFDKHGDQGFISRLSNDLSELKSSTVLPGSFYYGGGAISSLNLMQSSEGDIISSGWVGPKDFSSTPGTFDETQNGEADIYILKMDKDLSKVLLSTFIGGGRSERWSRMTSDSKGNIYIASYTHSMDFPTSKAAIFEKFHEVIRDEEENLGTSPRDAIVIRIDKDLSANVFEEFHDAAKKDNLKKVSLLLSQNGELLEKKDIYKRTALHSASRYGALSVSNYLIKKGANLSTRDENGNTALHLASLYSQDEIVELLVNLYDDINAPNNDGLTPLSLAAIYGTPKTMELLLSNEADGNIKNNEGNTPLHLATLYGQIEKVREIMKFSPEMDSKNKAGKTPLLLASGIYENEQIIECLIDHGANMTIADSTGKSVLHIASPSNISLLIKKGADINLQDRDGNTVLHNVFKQIVQILKNPQMFMLDLEEYISFQKNIVKTIMDAGADPNLKNNEGKSPMDLAVESEKKELIDLLTTKN